MTARRRPALIKGTALDREGREVEAYGYEFEDDFIVNARVSMCGRFKVKPSTYGLTAAQADELQRLNTGRNLLAFHDDEPVAGPITGET